MDKKCTKCKETKALELFSKQTARKCGRTSHCKVCLKIYRDANKSERNSKAKIYRDVYKPEIKARRDLYNATHKPEIAARDKRYRQRIKAETRLKISLHIKYRCDTVLT